MGPLRRPTRRREAAGLIAGLCVGGALRWLTQPTSADSVRLHGTLSPVIFPKIAFGQEIP
jgi:hypothetical protein